VLLPPSCTGWLIYAIAADRVSGEGNATGRVRPPVPLFRLLSFESTDSDLEFLHVYGT